MGALDHLNAVVSGVLDKIRDRGWAATHNFAGSGGSE